VHLLFSSLTSAFSHIYGNVSCVITIFTRGLKEKNFSGGQGSHLTRDLNPKL